MFSSVDVHNHLQQMDVLHELFKLSHNATCLEQAGSALGLEPSELARNQVFRVDGLAVMVIIPSDREVDPEKLKTAAGAESVGKVPNDEITSLTGFLPAFLPPVGLKSLLPTYIDYYALKEEVVYTGCGEPNAILKIRSYDLVRATGGETVDIIRLDGTM